MDAQRNQFGSFFAGFPDVGFNELAVNVVNLDVGGLRYAVCAVGVIEKRHLEAIDVMNHRQNRIAVGAVAVDSEVGNIAFLESVDSASHSAVASVKDVIVGREDEVEACVGD